MIHLTLIMSPRCSNIRHMISPIKNKRLLVLVVDNQYVVFVRINQLVVVVHINQSLVDEVVVFPALTYSWIGSAC